MEEWRVIEGYPGYAVSNLGNVKSLSREVFNGRVYFTSKEKLLRQNTLAKGYKQVYLYRNGVRYCKQVHRLVAFAFITNPKPDKYDQINHINGIKDDNRVENLEWCDNSLNQLHAYRTGLNVHSPKSGRPKRKVVLTDKSGKEIIFESIADTLRFLGEHDDRNLRKILNKQYKTIKGYEAEYYRSI